MLKEKLLEKGLKIDDDLKNGPASFVFKDSESYLIGMAK